MDTNDCVDSTFQAGSVSETVLLEAVRYDTQTGLVPVVVQDASTGSVLTLAYANREALKRTFDTGQAWFWSRSRQEYWQKGATSGNTQRVVGVRLDCDGDAVLYLVEPAGPACHTGAETCFYREVTHHGHKPGSGWGVAQPAGDVVDGDVVAADGTDREATPVVGSVDGGPDREATAVVGSGRGGTDGQVTAIVGTTEGLRVDHQTTRHSNAGSPSDHVLAHLWEVMQTRWESRPQGSYTTYLFEHGVDKVAKKVGEECAEVVIAAKNANVAGGGAAVQSGRAELAQESADLLFHLFALWKVSGITPEAVYEVLRERAGK